MPNSDSLRQQGIRTDAATAIRVFAGQNAETFAIDLGAVFDTLNLRVENATPIPMARPPLPVQTAAEDANDFVNPFGTNAFSGFNINSIAIEVPITRLTADGQAANAQNGTIGVYASTSRQMLTVRAGDPGPTKESKPLLKGSRDFRQVSRMGNPLVNELIIRVGRKDFWNATDPADEAQFLDAYRALDVAQALQAVSGVPVPPTPREDIVQLLLKYAGQNPDPAVGPFAELLPLDMTVPPTPPAQIKRLSILAHDAAGNPTPDAAGFPNRHRPRPPALWWCGAGRERTASRLPPPPAGAKRRRPSPPPPLSRPPRTTAGAAGTSIRENPRDPATRDGVAAATGSDAGGRRAPHPARRWRSPRVADPELTGRRGDPLHAEGA